MHALAVFRVLGILLTVFSVTMLIPLFVGFFYQDVVSEAFLIAFAITLGTGLLCWLPTHKQRSELSIRDGFLVTVLFWAMLSFYGAIPLYLEAQPELNAVDSIFESISGLTTTGATVIQGLDELPKSVLFYRQQLQWLGGMGIVLLALAVLPMLGIGGMQLFRAEITGPVKDMRLTPRITETAKTLWYIYLSLTVICALAYWLAGMEPFDAIAHSFSTISIGGFSTHDSSIGFFANPAIELIAVVFIVISGINFGLHFSAFRHRSLRSYWSDLECKTFLLILTLMTLISSIVLIVQDEYDLVTGLRYGLFATVSIATTTGFTSADYSIWPNLLPFLLFLCSFAGGCAGSTGGGVKILRLLLIMKQGNREITRLIHPNAILPIKIGKTSVPDRVVDTVWGFFSVYIFTFIVMFIAVMATGLDLLTAFSAVAACLNNLGPGLGDVAQHYGDINQAAKWILCLSMLIGRLEIFTLLVLFSPTFWQK